MTTNFYLDHITPAGGAVRPGEAQRWQVEWPSASLAGMAIELQTECARAILRIVLPPEQLDQWFVAAWSALHSRVRTLVLAWDQQHPSCACSLGDFVYFTPKGGRSVHLFMLHTLRRWPSADRLSQYLLENHGSDWDLGLTLQAAKAARALGLGPAELAELHTRLAELHADAARGLRSSLAALLCARHDPEKGAALARAWEQIVRRIAAKHPDLAAVVCARDIEQAVDVEWAPDARSGRVFWVRQFAVPQAQNQPYCVTLQHIVHHAQGRRHVVLDCSLERIFVETPWSVACEVNGRSFRVDVAAHLIDVMFSYDMPEGIYPVHIVSANHFHAPPITLSGGALDGLLHTSPHDIWWDLVRMLFVESTFCCLVTKLSKKLPRLVYTSFAMLERWRDPSLSQADCRALLEATLSALHVVDVATNCTYCQIPEPPPSTHPALNAPADIFAPMLEHFRRSYCVLRHLSRTTGEAWSPCVGATLGWTGFADQDPDECRFIQRPWRLSEAPTAEETAVLRRRMDACRSVISEYLRDLLSATAAPRVLEDWSATLASHIATEGWERT